MRVDIKHHHFKKKMKQKDGTPSDSTYSVLTGGRISRSPSARWSAQTRSLPSPFMASSASALSTKPSKHWNMTNMSKHGEYGNFSVGRRTTTRIEEIHPTTLRIGQISTFLFKNCCDDGPVNTIVEKQPEDTYVCQVIRHTDTAWNDHYLRTKATAE